MAVSLPTHRPFRSWAPPTTIEAPRPSGPWQYRRPSALGVRRPLQTRRISRTSRIPGEAQTRPGAWTLDSRAPGAHRTRLRVPHYHWLTRLYRGTSRPCLIEPGGNAAYDYEAGTAVRRTTRPGDVSISRHLQNAKLLGQKTAIALIDCILGPLIDVRIPDGAVIGGNERNTAEGVVRSMPVQKRRTQALTLRILATAFCLAVRCDEEPLDTAGGDVIDPEHHFAQTWRVSGPLDRGGRRIACLRRDIQERVPKAIAVDQGEGDCPLRRING